MSCFPELTYAIYVDGELGAEEARAVEAHLAACPRCQQRVEALRSENRLLAEMLLEVEPAVTPAVAPAPVAGLRPIDLAWTTALVVGAAVGLNALVDWLSEVQAVEGTSWLNPLNLATQLTVLFNAIFYFVREGAAMLTSLSTTIVGLLLGAGVIWVSVVAFRRRHHTFAVLATLALVLLSALPAEAIETRHAKRATVTIEADQTIDDTLVVHAEKVIVNGIVTGNLLAFAEGVEINGTVKGDAICFAGGVNVKGTVEGNIFSFTGEINLEGRVGQSLYAFSGGTNIDSGASVGGDVVAFTGGANVEGTVERDVTAFAGGTSVGGTIGRHLRAYTDKLSVKSSARIGGDVRARVKRAENVKIDPGATIGGQVETTFQETRFSRYASPRFYWQNALGLAIIFLIGLLLYKLSPALFQARVDSSGALLRTAGVGFLALVAPPAAALVLGIVLCGIGILAGVLLIATLFPLLIVVVWLIGVYLAKVFVGYLLGQTLLRPAPGQPAVAAMPLLVGLVVIYVAVNLPYVGIAFRFVVWLLGLGILTVQLYRLRKAPVAA